MDFQALPVLALCTLWLREAEPAEPPRQCVPRREPGIERV